MFLVSFGLSARSIKSKFDFNEVYFLIVWPGYALFEPTCEPFVILVMRMKLILAFAFAGLVALSCSSSQNGRSGVSGIAFVEDFVEASTIYCREIEDPEEIRLAIENVQDPKASLAVGMEQMKWITKTCAQKFNMLEVFAGDDPILAYATFRMLVPDIWMTEGPPSEVEKLVSISELSSGSHQGYDWQCFYLEPVSEMAFSDLVLCAAEKNGEWRIFATYPELGFVNALKGVGYTSNEILGMSRRWMPSAMLKENHQDPSLSLLQLHWQSAEQGVWAEWKSRELGANEQGHWAGGYNPTKIATFVAERMTLEGVEAALLCDGDLPLDYLRQTAMKMEANSWQVNILIPAPIDCLAYTIPVEIVSLPESESVGLPTWSESSFRYLDNERIEISLREANDEATIKDLIPALVQFSNDSQCQIKEVMEACSGQRYEKGVDTLWSEYLSPMEVNLFYRSWDGHPFDAEAAEENAVEFLAEFLGEELDVGHQVLAHLSALPEKMASCPCVIQHGFPCNIDDASRSNEYFAPVWLSPDAQKALVFSSKQWKDGGGAESITLLTRSPLGWSITKTEGFGVWCP